MYTSDSDYEPSPSDLEDLRHSLLYLKTLEKLKDIRSHLDLRLPSIGVYLDGSDVLVCAYYSSSSRATVTMNDTDLLLEATVEHLLKRG